MSDNEARWIAACNSMGKRIAELEAQLSNALDPSHYSSKDGRIRELETKLVAAAKPVLTAEESAYVDVLRRFVADRDLLENSDQRKCLAIIDRLCPPKAPPTDVELADMLHRANGACDMDGPKQLILRVEQALRARGAK